MGVRGLSPNGQTGLRWTGGRLPSLLIAVVALLAIGVPAAATGIPSDSHGGIPNAQSQGPPPNFNGIWTGFYGGISFRITSGTSTSIVGTINLGPGCPGVSASVKGTIVNGSGEITIVEKPLIGQCILEFLGENTVTDVKVSGGVATSFLMTEKGRRGKYVGLQATVTNGQQPAPEALSVVIKAPSDPLAVGAEVNVAVTVTAVGGVADAITLGPGLVSTDAAVVTKQASGIDGFYLLEGASKTFVFTLNGAKAGTAALSVSATGTMTIGSVQASAQAQLTIKGSQIVVNTTSDEKIDDEALSPESGAPFCAIDASAAKPECSLRAAIQLVNKLGGHQTITFDIPGQGVPKIAPASALPAITASVTIDATTQAGGWVELNGANAGGDNGLELEGGNSTVRGLVINAFDKGAGVLIDKGIGDVIAGDRIGTNPTGTAAAGNLTGIDVNASDAVLGGTSDTSGSGCTGDCDLISGNHDGISIEKQQGATIEGDYIGTDVSGEAAVANYAGIDAEGDGHFSLNVHGIHCPGAAHGTVTIGGPTSEPGRAPGNVISGNSAIGVRVFCAATVQVAGNLIGLNAGGTRSLQTDEKSSGTAWGSARYLINSPGGPYVLRNLVGVDLLFDTSAMIGGPTKADENVIGGFQFGVRGLETSLDVTTNYTIDHDYIGTDIAGTSAVPNNIGVLSAPPDRYSDFDPPGIPNISVTDSLISGNLEYGMNFGLSLTGSRVGTNADGTAALPNMIGDQATLQVGGVRPAGSTTCDGPCNLISGNLEDGVAYSTTVQGNFIGTTISGTAALPNGTFFRAGLVRPYSAVTRDIQVGGASDVVARATCDMACNLIAGNDVAGIGAYNGQFVQGNLIGMGMTGLPLSNQAAGVVSANSSETDLKPAIIGGIGDLGNRIYDNAGSAVEVFLRDSPLVEGNSVAGNLGGIKIDTGANAPAAPQRVAVARGPTSYTVSGDVIGAIQGGSYSHTIDVYGGSSCEDSGAVPLVEFTTGSVTGSFSHELQGLSSNIRFITLTQSVDGSTSPYTPCVSVK